VFIGMKPVMGRVLGCIAMFQNDTDEVRIKTRGIPSNVSTYEVVLVK